ncbi:hypothetical protein SK854_23110 [Lentzea sp. BCCO 10_0061]|uniref:Restriction endonuclease n=1 Tax=Lentzea sokolovensis TaxID=3095429 RepID=A0ABU4UZQ4_9PSEU|nr:hypothetical protein [Lentzea sp. BCCO 10_0061]MDX8145018.1 hypothetical protein [Lentzea sp. BCCO 10_0061]
MGLIHLESHFTDEKAGLLRAETYRRLRRHWQFINELILFEIEHHKRYGVNIYSASREPHFVQAASLYHPDMVERSLRHDGSGVEPGIKDPDGNWDQRPHSSRIVHVNRDTLTSWHAVLETDEIPVGQTRMVYAVNQSTADVLDKLAQAPRIGSLGLQFSRGWDESIDRKKGLFDAEWGVPEFWGEVILQGPHLHVATPFYKTPNPTMLHNQDWTTTDFEALATDAIPATAYKPRGDRGKYDAAYTHWTSKPEGSVIAARDHFRLAWRNMAANTGERTLIPALIPPGAAHVDGIYSLAVPADPRVLVSLAASMSSLISDFAVRVAPKSTIRSGTASRLPQGFTDRTRSELLLRTLRLNCVNYAYAKLWEECFDTSFRTDEWAPGSADSLSTRIGEVGPEWTPETPLRRAVDRRQAILEVDALVALSLGITADELCTIYRTQFPVLHGYDTRSTYYDGNGRLVPSAILTQWRRRGMNDGTYTDDELAEKHRGSGIAYQYVVPFIRLDRERDLRAAYAEFMRRVTSRS